MGDDYVEVLRTNLHSAVARHRILALRGTVRQRLVTSEDWRAAFGDRRRRRATRGAESGRPRGDRRRRGLRRHACVSSMTTTRSSSTARVFALGEHLYVAAVEQMCVIATTHEDARCRESAIAALGAIGDDRARPAILAALDDKPPVRRRAIVALSNFEGPDIEAALARASEDRDWQVRAAVNQLGRDDD